MFALRWGRKGLTWDYWANYEKHLNAFRAGCSEVDRAVSELGTRKANFRRAMTSKDLMAKQRAKGEHGKYLQTVQMACSTAERQGSLALARLTSYIRNKKDFPEAGQHRQNIRNAVARVQGQKKTIVAEAQRIRQIF